MNVFQARFEAPFDEYRLEDPGDVNLILAQLFKRGLIDTCAVQYNGDEPLVVVVQGPDTGPEIRMQVRDVVLEYYPIVWTA